MSPEQIARLQAKGMIRKANTKGAISKTQKNIIVIRVQFSGSPVMSLSKASTEAFFGRMRDYYYENSYGLFTASATVSENIYTLSTVNNYNQEDHASLAKLLEDSINAADGDIDISKYDYVMIYHAGRGEEASGEPSDLWSLFYDVTYTVGGKSFDGFTVVPECYDSGSPFGTICHEFGHQLGLPDLYDTTIVQGNSSVVGAWSLMDYAYGYDNTGENPPHLDPWSKNYLKFIDLDGRLSKNYTSWLMGDIETSQTTGFYKIPVFVDNSTEYFIVENRTPDPSKIKYDIAGKAIAGSGLLIWHIDDAIALNASRLADNTVNSGSPNLGVDLVEADNTTSYPWGDAGDAFGTGGMFTSPQSNTFSGEMSCILISNIVISGDVAVINISSVAVSDTVNVMKLANYPNPAGKGYPHPTAGVLTTIVLSATRPPADIRATIYNLAGEKVAEITGFQQKRKASDYNFILESDWDGKNESGEQVAPGIYFIRLKADNQTKVTKMAIVR